MNRKIADGSLFTGKPIGTETVNESRRLAGQKVRFCRRGGSRTHTAFRPGDFKSPAYASSATRPGAFILAFDPFRADG